jgi:type IV pilus assembly protein PilO
VVSKERGGPKEEIMALNSEFIVKMPLIQKVIILGAVILLILLGYYFFFHTKLVDELASLKKTLTEQQANLDKLKLVEKDIESIRAQIEAKQRELEKLKSKLPTEAEMEKLLLDLSEKGKLGGLTFSDIKPMGERPGKDNLYMEVPISLKLSGSYKFLMTFFSKVVSMERIINFANIVITCPEGSRKSGGSAEVQVNCTAVTYRFKE